MTAKTKVTITLDTRKDDKFRSSREQTGIKGDLSESITQLATIVDIQSFHTDQLYTATSSVKTTVAIIVGTSSLTLPELLAKIYSNDMISTRMHNISVEHDTLQLSTQPQQHVPTEDELISAAHQRICTCHIGSMGTGDPDDCDVHG